MNLPAEAVIITRTSQFFLMRHRTNSADLYAAIPPQTASKICFLIKILKTITKGVAIMARIKKTVYDLKTFLFWRNG